MYNLHYLADHILSLESDQLKNVFEDEILKLVKSKGRYKSILLDFLKNTHTYVLKPNKSEFEKANAHLSSLKRASHESFGQEIKRPTYGDCRRIQYFRLSHRKGVFIHRTKFNLRIFNTSEHKWRDAVGAEEELYGACYETEQEEFERGNITFNRSKKTYGIWRHPFLYVPYETI